MKGIFYLIFFIIDIAVKDLDQGVEVDPHTKKPDTEKKIGSVLIFILGRKKAKIPNFVLI